MEKNGKIKIRTYNSDIDINISVDNCIIKEGKLYIAYVSTYDNTILVYPENMPKWLLTKIRGGKVSDNDDIVVSVDDNNIPLLDDDNHAIATLPKLWSHEVEELFEERYTKNAIVQMFQDYELQVSTIFITDKRHKRKSKEFLEEFLKLRKLL